MFVLVVQIHNSIIDS